MPFLPSLLEYTPQALNDKLGLINNNLLEFRIIQQATDQNIYLHLDFVLPEFASSRNVDFGNNPEVVFKLIHKYFQDQKVVCNCHFMGLEGDYQYVSNFFKSYNWNPNWRYIMYVGSEFVNDFENLTNKNVKIGAWLDLDQYHLHSKFELSNYLLMTVFAGKSGQKLTNEVRSNTLEIVLNNPEVNFTIDGGWAVNDEFKELNLQQKSKLGVVSYSSFWKELEIMTTNKK